MNRIEEDYLELLEDILRFGIEKKENRNGGTISVFGRQLRHKMKTGFPLLTTKKMAFKTMVTELLWFLRGDTNIKYLVDNNCHIWDGDAYKNYLHKVISDKDIVRYLKSYSIDTKGVPTIEPYSKDEFIERIKTDKMFAFRWGELGPIYGAQWRRWFPGGKDQIENLINDLKTNPDSRRLMVSAWNVGELDQMVLPPCHYGFQVYTRELTLQERMDEYKRRNLTPNIDPLDLIPTRSISLMWNQRSVDTALGLPFNISSYALLLMMIAKQVDMVPDELICNLGDCHIYLNQIEGVKEQIDRKPYDLPRLKLSDRKVNDISEYTLEDITLENYQYHPTIKMPLSN
jgi:thymidylate synthase